MNARRNAPHAVESWADAIAGSGSVVHLGGKSATARALLDLGRARWQAYRAHQFPALLGIGDIDMLSLLFSAIVDQYTALLCPADSAPPAMCDVHIPAGVTDHGVNAFRGNAFPPADSTEWPDGLAVLSSGTLGTPKVIWHRHRDLLATSALVMRRLKLAADDRVLITVPLHHMYGLGAALLPALLANAEIHLLPKANLLGFNDAVRAFEPTMIFSTPHLLRALLQRKSESLETCRGIVLAGDGIPPMLHAQARRVFNQVFDLYGSSELGVVALSEPDLPQALYPLDGVRVFPADSSTGQSNLIVVHPHAATHIAHHGTISALPSEWDTRDIASFSGNAGFAIRGRADHSLNRAGKLLVLAELERTVMGWPGVELAVAIVLEDETAAGKAIALVIKPSAATLTIDVLKQLASTTLPAFARPDRYTLVADMPRLGSGKPDRNTIIKDHCHG
jgi:acyl-coenzyme A synthetase/AMP-(fatty) acid ligase